MVRDEAPAATIGGVNGIKESDRAEIGSAGKRRVQFLRSGPTSLVAAEIHLGLKPAGICGGWLHCNIQVMCHGDAYKLLCNIK
jgi:hypothetical protein